MEIDGSAEWEPAFKAKACLSSSSYETRSCNARDEMKSELMGADQRENGGGG